MTSDQDSDNLGEDDLNFIRGLGSNPRNADLAGKFLSFRDGVLHLRRYIPVALQALEAFESETPTDISEASFAARLLDDATRAGIRDAVDAQLTEIQRSVDSMPFSEKVASGLNEEQALADPWGTVNKLLDMSALNDIYARQLARWVPRSWEEQAYWATYLQASQGRNYRHLLLRSLYVVASSVIQPAIAELVLTLQQAEQDRAETPAARSVLDGEVTRLLGQGPSEWRKRLVKRFGLKTLENGVDWPELERMWRRRNLFVHRGGWIDTAFRGAEPTAPPVGSPLELSVDDIYGAFDFAGGVRMGVLVAASDVVNPGMGNRFAEGHGLMAMEDLHAERWWLAEGISRAAMAMTDDVGTWTIAQVNLWLARSGRLGVEAVRSEVEAWDAAAAGPEIELAKAVLLEQDEESVALAAGCLARGEISRLEFRVWPLFARMRRLQLLDDVI